MREKLIDLLDETVADCMPSECLEEIADHLIANGVTFATDNNVGGWIPVSERLPEVDGKYIVARRDGGYYSISVRKFRKEVPCWYTGYCGHWERRTNGITHWMPLPEPPKGE